MNLHEQTIQALLFLVVLFSGLKVFSTNLKKSIFYFLIEGAVYSTFLFSLGFYSISFSVLFISALSTYVYYYFSNITLLSKEEESFYSIKTFLIITLISAVFFVGTYKGITLGIFKTIVRNETHVNKENLGTYIYYKSPEIFFILSLLLSITPAAFLTLTGKRKI